MTFRHVWKICAPLAIILMVLAGAGCKSLLKKAYRDPKVKVVDVALTDVSTSGLELGVNVEIDNPNPIKVSFSGMEYDLVVDNLPMAKGRKDSLIEIKASDKTNVTIPVELNYNQMAAVYNSSIVKDRVPYTLSGKVFLNTPVGSVPLPYQASGTMPVVKPPTLRGVKNRTNSLSTEGLDMTMTLVLDNPNGYPLVLQNLEYQLNLNGQEFSSTHSQTQTLPAKGRGEVNLPVKLNFSSLGQWAVSLVTSGQASYSLKYRATFIIDGKPVRQTEVNQGTIKLR